MTFITTEDFLDYERDPEKIYASADGGVMEFDNDPEYQMWINQK